MAYQLAEDEIDETLPETVKNFLKKGYSLEDITLHADGKWTHEGCDFENPRIVDAFSRGINRTEGGTWVIELGRFTYPIRVEDAGFFVERVDLSADPPQLTLSDETTEPLDPTTIHYASGGRLYCRVKDDTFRARFKRPAYYTLSEHFEERDGTIYMVMGDTEIALTTMDDDEIKP